MRESDGSIQARRGRGRRDGLVATTVALAMWATAAPMGQAQAPTSTRPEPRRDGTTAAAGASTGVPAGRAGAPPTDLRAAADQLQSKLEEIVRFGAIPRLETQTTRLHEHELNAYVWTYLMADLPPGVTEPKIELVGDNVLRGSVVLDMDAYRAARPPGEGLDPLALLSGRLTARVRGRLVTADGVGQFEVQSAELGGIPLPPSLVQRLVTYYSRTPAQPDGVRIDEPFYLPVSIREIVVEPRSALVVQ